MLYESLCVPNVVHIMSSSLGHKQFWLNSTESSAVLYKFIEHIFRSEVRNTSDCPVTNQSSQQSWPCVCVCVCVCVRDSFICASVSVHVQTIHEFWCSLMILIEAHNGSHRLFTPIWRPSLSLSKLTFLRKA